MKLRQAKIARLALTLDICWFRNTTYICRRIKRHV